MLVKRCALIAALAGVLSAPGGVSTAAPSPTQPRPATEQATPMSGPVRVLTLVTGDRVTTRGGTLAGIEPGEGREDVRFSQYVLSGDLYVIPSDAGPLIGSGRLDQRLFNVSQQLEWGYDDAQQHDVPVIADRVEGDQRITARDASVVRSFTETGMDVLRVDKDRAGSFWESITSASGLRFDGSVERLWLDGQVEASLDESVPQIGAPAAWRRGLTGKGTTVAVLDTGYDPTHPDLKGAVTRTRGFTGAGPEAVRDWLGHGTHVASTIAGSGAASGGKYRGVAPGADLAIGKVLDNYGSGYDSWILAGMEWAATRANADVVNLSLGADDLQGEQPLERAINQLTRTTGTLFVVAAGNSGPDERTLGSPGTATAALAVGAVDGDDQLAGFSSRGPRLGDFAIKPEVTAPGVGITAAVPGRKPYARYSGTSMATPHVAGAAAVLAGQHPNWRARRLKAALIGATRPTSGADEFEQGAGRIDVRRAIRQPVVTTTPNLSTYLRYPNRGAVTRQVTYVNTSNRPVTLRLSTPEAPFELGRRSVTVPAHGRAIVRVTIDPGTVEPGPYADTLVARSGKAVVRTLLGGYVEPPAYNLSVDAIAPDDARVDGLLVVHSQTRDFWELVYIRDGHLTHPLRLPAGEYNLDGPLDTRTAVTIVNEPVDLRSDDTNLVVDLGRAVPATMTLDAPGTESKTQLTAIQYHRDDSTYLFGMSNVCFVATCDPMRVLPVEQAGLIFVHYQRFRDTDGPSLYHVVDRREGGIPEDPSYRAELGDLARVPTTFRAAGTPAMAARASGATLVLPGRDVPVFTVDDWFAPTKFRLPATVTDYFTVDPDLRWWRGLYTDRWRRYLDGAEHPYTPGVHPEIWNAAVLGPALGRRCGPALTGWCGVRDGNRITWSGWTNLAADSGARGRWSNAAVRGTATLWEGRRLIARTALGRDLHATLPRRCGTYRLVVDAARPWATLSTGIRTVTTFRSCHTDRRTSLALAAVRFAPEGLDRLNRAPAGETTRIPIWVERYGDTPIESLTVQASYDGGKTWHRTDLERAGADWVASVDNPDSGYVALRAVAVDADGNRVAQVVRRAYASAAA